MNKYLSVIALVSCFNMAYATLEVGEKKESGPAEEGAAATSESVSTGSKPSEVEEAYEDIRLKEKV